MDGLLLNGVNLQGIQLLVKHLEYRDKITFAVAQIFTPKYTKGVALGPINIYMYASS